ncbi:MAG: hypothetical protein CSB55_09120 [Candidatus Cloacimonadota bacterium]|nr:MAG: hypothetical protein CSB55_09120 [Candidatus Cloacimonadota bacterium]
MENKIHLFWEKISEKLEKTYGENLIQVVIYRPYLSTGRTAIILKDDSVSMLLKSRPIINEIRKKKLPAPLFFSPRYIKTSLDTFPLEFLDIKSDYENIYSKEDLFKDLDFEKSDIRHQMERELKGKWLHLKMAILDYGEKPAVMKEILGAAVQSVLPTVKGLIFLNDRDIPKNPEEMFKLADELTSFSLSSFNRAFKILKENAKIKKEEMIHLFEDFSSQLKDYMQYTDTVNYE